MKYNDLTEKQQNIYKNLQSQIDSTFKACNEKGFRTRERYQQGCYSFAIHLSQTYGKANISKMTNKHIESYIKVAQDEWGLSTSAVTTNLSAIRYFYRKRVGKQFRIKTNKQLGVNPRTKKERIGRDRAMPDLDYQHLLKKCDEKRDPITKIKLEISERFGLRIMEVHKIRHSTLNEIFRSKDSEKVLPVVGKGGLIRYLPLSNNDIRFLKKVNEITHSKTDRIFVKESEDTKQKIDELKTFISTNRLSKEYSHHGLRHRYAQKLYNELRKSLSDYDSRVIVSSRLGHSRIDVTYTYLDSR